MTDDELLGRSYLRFRHTAAFATALFFIVGLLASYFGFTSLHMDFDIFGGEGFTGIMISLGVVVAFNERIMELVTQTYRRNTGAVIELRMSLSAPDKKQAWEEFYLGYKAETGRLVLTLSLVFGCLLACTGFFRLLEGLSVDELISSEYHRALFDATDIVVTGWIIAGGSQGYYKLIDLLSNAFKLKKDLDQINTLRNLPNNTNQVSQSTPPNQPVSN
ncbi:hypothetical protein [Flavobacterium sp.]|uniref:hypothetical protein n=1 Tax=Flavobacterium sp. TaxID=239 RepID=UPI00260E3E48|nr:hypothetical protein [Flavobacterium sp.]